MAEDELKSLQKFFNTFDGFRQRRKGWRALIDREDVIDVGDLYHDVGLRYHSFEPQHRLSQYTAVLDTASTTASVKARSERQDDKEKAQLWEHWLNTAIPAMDSGKSSPARLSRSRRVWMGVDIWKFDLREEWIKRPEEADADYQKRLKDDRESKMRLGLPFIWSSVDPLTCAWFENADGLQVVMEQSERAVNPILKEFGQSYKDGVFTDLAEGESVGESFESMTEHVKFTQVSTPEKIRYYVESKGERGRKEPKLLHEFDNPWGRPPYVVVPALLQATALDPDKRYVPLIFGTLVVTKVRNFVESLVMLAGYLTATPTYDLFTAVGQPVLDEQTKKTIEMTAGRPMKYPVPAGAKWEQRTIKMGVDMDKLIARVDEDLREFGFPTGLTGEAPQPRTPAYAYAEAAGRATLHIDPATRAEEAAFVQMAELLGGCIKNYIREEIPILGRVEDDTGKANVVTISGDDILDFDVKMGVSVPNTSLQLAKKEMDRKDVEDDFLSPDTYQEEDMGIKDVERENRLIRKGKLQAMMEPSIHAQAIQMHNAKVKARTGIDIPVPEGVPTTEGGAPEGRTRPAQQVRPPQSEPTPHERMGAVG